MFAHKPHTIFWQLVKVLRLAFALLYLRTWWRTLFLSVKLDSSTGFHRKASPLNLQVRLGNMSAASGFSLLFQFGSRYLGFHNLVTPWSTFSCTLQLVSAEKMGATAAIALLFYLLYKLVYWEYLLCRTEVWKFFPQKYIEIADCCRRHLATFLWQTNCTFCCVLTWNILFFLKFMTTKQLTDVKCSLQQSNPSFIRRSRLFILLLCKTLIYLISS
jgi:hypothetical protein